MQTETNYVLNLLDSCLTSAKEIWPTLPLELPTLEWKDNGRKAGTAYSRANTITLSPTLYKENKEEFAARTIPHELAHLITDKLFPEAKQAHGPEWRYVCRCLGMQDITRCHSYDTTSVSHQTRYSYSCSCKEHFVSATIHNKIKRGSIRICRACKTTIKLNIEP